MSDIPEGGQNDKRAVETHVLSIAIGAAMLLGGLALAIFAPAERLLALELPKLGIILAALGALEVVVSGIALASSATRHRLWPL